MYVGKCVYIRKCKVCFFEMKVCLFSSRTGDKVFRAVDKAGVRACVR